MLYQEFYRSMFELACFTSHQVYAWRPGFDKNNLGRWVRKGLLVKLRNGFYSFPEYLNESGFAFFIANHIYKPSYISLHTALAFHGLIPESIVHITSVTTLKTTTIQNTFGTFSYKTIKPDMMFGYDYLPFSKGKTLLMAKPEKALLDLLYLYPFYNTEDELKDLRLEEDFMQNRFNADLLHLYALQSGITALQKRVALLRSVYMP